MRFLKKVHSSVLAMLVMQIEGIKPSDIARTAKSLHNDGDEVLICTPSWKTLDSVSKLLSISELFNNDNNAIYLRIFHTPRYKVYPVQYVFVTKVGATEHFTLTKNCVNFNSDAIRTTIYAMQMLSRNSFTACKIVDMIMKYNKIIGPIFICKSASETCSTSIWIKPVENHTKTGITIKEPFMFEIRDNSLGESSTLTTGKFFFKG